MGDDRWDPGLGKMYALSARARQVGLGMHVGWGKQVWLGKSGGCGDEPVGLEGIELA